MDQALLGGAGTETQRVPPERRGELPQNSLRIPSGCPERFVESPSLDTTLSEVPRDSVWEGRVGR